MNANPFRPGFPWREVTRVGAQRFYQGPAPVPGAWNASRVEVEPERARHLERLERDVAPAPTRLALVERSADATVASSSGGLVAELTRKAPLDYEVKLPQAGRGFLCTAVGYYSEWRAFDGETPLPVVRVNHGFIGVKLEQPASSVTLRFVPESHQRGLKISLLCLGLWFLFVIASRSWKSRGGHSLKAL
ncbi:MAG: hypothetical protein HY360_01280 [Verrucomicrobia bacterium]|nr:hypothetical protein [Verrucomicrobiota bacterium]